MGAPLLERAKIRVKPILDKPRHEAQTRIMKRKDRILADVFASVGTAAALGALLGVSRSAVSQWRQVPLRHLREVSQITGIPRRELRPDLYDEEAEPK